MNLLTKENKDSEFCWRQIAPLPIISEGGEEEYEVEKILSWKQTHAGLWYLICWKGYGPEEDTFKQVEKFSTLKDLMDDFLTQHPGALVPKNYKCEQEGSKAIKVKAILTSPSATSSTLPPAQDQITLTASCLPSATPPA